MREVGEINRDAVNALLRKTMEQNPQFYAVWSAWEPNALDGQDEIYRNTEGTDESGRFITYWVREGDQLTINALENYDVPGEGDYYLIARDTGKDTVLEPYEYEVHGEKVLLSSLVSPSEIIQLEYPEDQLTVVYEPIHVGSQYWSVATTVPVKEMTVQADQLLRIIILISIIGMIIITVVILFVTNQISKPIELVAKMGDTMAQGDFRINLPEKLLHRRDEIGVIANTLQKLTEAMKEMIGQVSHHALQVASAAQQISATSEEIASASNNQATDAQKMNDMFIEFNHASKVVMQNARNASELSDRSKLVANEGGKMIDQSISDLKLVFERISTLEKDSAKIGDITEVIEDIAEQTNLLALNAAIEAARAGEQGRGFAVVADEVRKLAERSGDATKQITEIIKGMQHNTDLSVSAVHQAVENTAKIKDAFHHIVQMVNESSLKVNEISVASEQQSAQSNEVFMAIETISATSQEAAAASEEAAASTQSLAKLAEELNDTVSVFKLQ